MTTTEQRKLMRELHWWLDGDLFDRARCPDDADEETTVCFRSPIGWTVLLSPRQDGSGWAGEVRSPDGSRVSTTSWADVQWLDEHLP